MEKLSKDNFSVDGRKKRYGLYIKWKGKNMTRGGITFEYWLKHHETEL